MHILNRKEMDIQKLIDKLTALRDNYKVTDVHFSVKDYYGVYGKDATLVGSEDGKFWEGTFTNDGHTTISMSLSKDFEGKVPKITFRKP